MRICIVGAGVSGLTTALQLLQAGHRDVTVLSKHVAPDPAVASYTACAVWFPYEGAPLDKVKAWSRTTHDAFVALADAGDVDETGVRMEDGTVLCKGAEVDMPFFSDYVHGFHIMNANDVKAAQQPMDTRGQFPKVTDATQATNAMDASLTYKSGYEMKVPCADMSVYMPYLFRRVRDLGGLVAQCDVTSLGSLYGKYDVVINCAGLQAGTLCNDHTMKPVRGHIVQVMRNASEYTRGVCRFYDLYDTEGGIEQTYIFLRQNELYIGGTYEMDVSDPNPDMALADRILARAAKVIPGITHCARGEPAIKVGFRPWRPEVRVEADGELGRGGGTLVVHNYGHGGIGMTLSYGCAEEVVQIVNKHAHAARL